MDANTTGLAEYYEEVDNTPTQVEPAERKRGRKPTRARTRPLDITFNESLDIEPVKFACRCWRCRAGGVAVSNMGALDQILARHLLRMPEPERDGWLREWEVNPNHGPGGRRALDTWMAIDQGNKLPEPVYTARVSYE